MVITKAQHLKIFQHVMSLLQEEGEDDNDTNIMKVLKRNGVKDVLSLVNLSDDDIRNMKITTKDKKEYTLNRGQQGLLQQFIRFHRHKFIQNMTGTKPTPFDIETYLHTNKDEFDSFRIQSVDIQLESGRLQPDKSMHSNERKDDNIFHFRKNIKRDQTLFKVFKDEKLWDPWYVHTIAQARSQDVAEVFDPSYVPSTPSEIAPFDAKQRYVFAMFTEKLQTDYTKSLVRQHIADYDAQSIFASILDHAQRSTKASIEASDILEYITTARYGNDTWKGSAESFILHWQEQVRLYDQMVGLEDVLSTTVKTTMLQNSVHSVDDLRAIKVQADQFKVQNKTPLSYEEYVSLLISAAQNYDKTFKTKPNSKNIQRRVYNHEVVSSSEPSHNDDDDDIFYDIDSDIDVIRAYNANTITKDTYEVQNAEHTRLPEDVWNKLDRRSQRNWNNFDSQTKSLILKPTTDNKKDPDVRSVNLHDLSLHDYLQIQAHVHNTMPDKQPNPNSSFNDSVHVNQASQKPLASKTLPPGDIHRLMSSKMNTPTPDNNTNNSKEITIDGIKYRSVNQHQLCYSTSHHHPHSRQSLVDRGANGGISGDDVRVIHSSDRLVNVQGIDNHQVIDIPIVTAGGVTHTKQGPILIILNQYAHVGKGKSIHSSIQLETFGNDVNDRSIKVKDGLQRIKTPDGHNIPLSIKAGLPYMKLRPFTDDEWDSLPHVVLTSDTPWDPSIADNDIDENDIWYDAQQDLPPDDDLTPPTSSLFDENGRYRNRQLVHQSIVSDSDLDDNILPNEHFLYQVHEKKLTPSNPDYEKYIPYFGWAADPRRIEHTFNATTQYAKVSHRTDLRHTFKAPFPALNVPRREEDLATDTFFSDVPAIDSGDTMAQFYCGVDSLVCDVYPMKSEKQFVNTLEDMIRHRGAPNRLLSDQAPVETKGRALDLLRNYVIGNWNSEPWMQHQNPAERRYQTIKRATNRLMDRTGSPANLWLLAILYVCFVFNHLAHPSLHWRTPLETLTGRTPDISSLLRFYWYQPVYYLLDDSDFPSTSTEGLGRFVGVAEHVGHRLTYKILTDDTQKVIHRSSIRPATDPASPNLRLALFDGEISNEEHHNDGPIQGNVKDSSMKFLHKDDIVGRTFLTPPTEDGERFRARVVRAIDDHQHKVEEDPTLIRFLCSVDDDRYEEIMSYNEILHHIEQQSDDDRLWQYKRIASHEGPLTKKDAHYMGSNYNVLIEWETGEITREPLNIIAADDPVTCAIYAQQNNLLEQPGWRRFRRIANRQKKLFRMANQAKLRSFRNSPKYMYGYLIPKNWDEAVKLDDRNGNTKWQDCTKLEMEQLHEYDTFINMGRNATKPAGYKNIRVHLVFAVKHDLRHKARLVANGNMTEVPFDSVYSGVVSLRGLRIMLFLAEHNNLQTWATDIGNAYLEAVTSEKVFIYAGEEFGKELQGCLLIIYKALYGLRTSGARWHDKFADTMASLNFVPCKNEPDIWMRPDGDIYEYVAVYVDDLAFVMRDPESFVDTLRTKFNYKLKGTGSIAFHLGCDFFRDEDNILCMAPKKYIDKTIDAYTRMFGQQPSTKFHSPLEKGDHPELDTSPLLEPEDVQKYQSIVGSLQWAVSLGRIDVCTAVMTLSSFRTAPRIGHLERAKRVVGYLAKMRHAILRFRTTIPDYSDLTDITQQWERSVYGDIKEAIPHDAPDPLGNPVVLTHYVDANLMHDLLTGRSVTGILHFLNGTPIDWYSKKQTTAETATYGSEYVAARTCVEQIIDLRLTLYYLGVKIIGPSRMFGDNESVVDSSMRFDSKLHKRHVALSYHRVRESIAANICRFYHLVSEINPADILSKHWGYQTVWRMLRPLMFWQGDTADATLS